MSTLFRKKPVEVEAIRVTSDLKPHDLFAFLGSFKGVTSDADKRCLYISTLEGVMKADEGDWIIKGVKGEFYPCKPDIFAVTYEPVAPRPAAPSNVPRYRDGQLVNTCCVENETHMCLLPVNHLGPHGFDGDPINQADCNGLLPASAEKVLPPSQDRQTALDRTTLEHAIVAVGKLRGHPPLNPPDPLYDQAVDDAVDVLDKLIGTAPRDPQEA